MEKPFVSIVIPAYNSAATLRETIRACLDQDYPKDRLEVIVVDDGSADDTGKIAESFQVGYIYQKRKGPASARNNGWRNSKGRAICFTDADCVPYKDWVSGLARHFYIDDISAVAGSYAPDSSRYLLDKFVHFEIKFRHSMMPEYVNSFGTYNVMIKRDVLEELGGFDPGYSRASGEDSDLSCRIIGKGHKIYFEKNALVGHSNILRFCKYIAVQFRHGYWRLKIYRKNKKMIIRDDYSYWKDFAEVFLVMALALSLALRTNMISACLASILFLIQVPLVVRISLREKDIRYMAFSLVTFIRAFARVAGGVLGFIRFWVVQNQHG
jgi:glycosyltransferase involved in cell wall biosynthesis